MVEVEEGREFSFRGDLYSQESTFPLVIHVLRLCVCRELKSCLIASIVFVLQMRGIFFVSAPFSVVYFGVVLFLVYFDLVAELVGAHDPLSVLENAVCAVLFSCWRRSVDTSAAEHHKTD